MHPSRRLLAILALAMLVAIAGACGGDENKEPRSQEPIDRGPEIPIVIPAGEPIVVGVSAALTGPSGARGEEYRDAAIVAVERWKAAHGEQIAGHEISVHAEDDGCTDSDITQRAAGHLLRGEDGHGQVPGLVGVLGPQCSGGVEAVLEDYAASGMVMISGSATATTLTTGQGADGFFFRTAYRNDLEGTLIGLFLSQNPELGIERAYLIDNGETYGEDLAANAGRVAEENGLTVVRESITEGTVDFSELADRIAAEDPGFVGFAGFNPEAALLYRQLRDAGYEGIFGAGDGAASGLSFIGPVGVELAEGVLFAGCTFPLPQDFIDDFVDLHGSAPTAAFPAQFADAATVLLDAVAEVAQEGADGSVTIVPSALRDAVRATVLEDGLSGAIAFDENGDRLPPGVASLEAFLAAAVANQDPEGYVDLGLIPCQVQDGRLVNLLGPDAGEIRLEE